ncbi:MAG: OmpA family protein, partial [Bacteroidota bacterium]
MKRSTTIFFAGLLALAAAGSSPAQFKDQGLGFGGSFGGTFANTELRDRKPDHFARAFMRYGILDNVAGELGVGAGYIKGLTYRTQIFPIDYRLVWNPLPESWFSPYLYAGAGILRFDAELPPPNPTPGEKTSGWAPFFPGGVGIQILTMDNVALEFTGGYNYTLKDNLNAVVAGPKDQYVTFTGGLTVVGESPSADPDGDGLTNREEKELGTDRKSADSDADGLSDGEEVKQYSTNPLKPDSDGDGLADGAEVKTHRTDPNATDTDGDTLGDGAEVNTHKTDPTRHDTDGDGLADGAELNLHKTDPLKADTDGDTLSDAEEVNTHRTDPLKPDTDGGTVADAVEIGRGTNPLDPADDVKEEIKVEVGKAIVLDGIVFETGKAVITPESEALLEKAYNTLFQNPEIEVEIHGYTDNTGRKATNQRLSEARAEAVKTWLVARGIAAGRIGVRGFGPENPVAPNTTKEGRQQNRRIEFFRA